MPPWYLISTPEAIPSPALLVYPDRVAANIERAVALAGGADRLRPHVKTHKMKEVAQLQMAAGIRRFKCATMEEAAMLGEAGTPDVLIAYPLVGPNAERLVRLAAQFPGTRFSCLADDAAAARALSDLAVSAGRQVPVFVDVNVGMNRTGIVPAKVPALAAALRDCPGIRLAGLHAYDGHIHDTATDERKRAFDEAMREIPALRENLQQTFGPLAFVGGGSPTAPFHAQSKDRECSPGTFVFWDRGYGVTLPDLPFEPAAAVMTRVISLPAPGVVTLDLGTKAVAAEMPHPRVHLLNGPGLEPVSQNEEHLVCAAPKDHGYRVGDVLYGLPWHICPTVNLYAFAHAIRDGKPVGAWTTARR